MMATYEVRILDEDRNQIGDIDIFDKLTLEINFNDLGKWMIQGDYGKLSSLSWRGGIEVLRNGSSIFTGPVIKIKDKYDRRGNQLVISGADDMVYLRNRLVLPVPSGPPYTSQEFDNRSGVAETIMKEYVDYNVGANAKSERARLTVEADSGRGETVEEFGSFDNLLELLQSIAISGGGLGFRVVDKEFQVYEVSDVSNTVIFSDDPDEGTILAYDYLIESSKSNYVYVGGDQTDPDDNTTRTYFELQDSESITKYYDRVEDFIDRRDSSDTDILKQTALEFLDKNKEKIQLSFVPRDTTGQKIQDDYWVGYKVTFFIKGVEIQEVIRGIRIDVDRGGESIEPVIASEGVSIRNLSSLFQDPNLKKRIDRLERR